MFTESVKLIDIKNFAFANYNTFKSNEKICKNTIIYLFLKNRRFPPA